MAEVQAAPSARRWWIIAGAATLLAGAGVLLPVLALPAFLAVTLTCIALDGRPRRLVVFVGVPLMLASFGRFLLAVAIPNIVTAGERAAEDKAVSRLREIRWAEQQARQLKFQDLDHDGNGEFVSITELMKGEDPLLKPGLYQPVGNAGVVRTEAYEVGLYLPAKGGGWTLDPAQADPARASQTFVAYAWPAGERHGGSRAFFIDQEEQICELKPSPWTGPNIVPPASAALEAMKGGKCPPLGTPGWHIWRKKKLASAQGQAGEATR